MDDIAEYLLVPQPGAVNAAADRSRPATDPLRGSQPAVPEVGETLEALRKLLHDKVVLKALLRLTGTD